MRNPVRSSRVRLMIGIILVAALAVWLLASILQRELRSPESQSANPQATLATLATQTAFRAAHSIHVVGNQLVTRAGQPVILHGVNRGGTDYFCAEGKGIFDGPTGPSSIVAMQSWHINSVRIPLNEACWLGAPAIPPQYSGAAYQDAIASYVQALTNRGIYVILDLHKSAPGNQINTHTFQPMPDADHSVTFWQQVANRFKGNGMVLFDLFNEPHHVDWNCWLVGGRCPNISYSTVGMQKLVTTVRDAGASNVLLVSGLDYASDLRGFLVHMPEDPLHNMAASMHIYMTKLSCATALCYNQDIAPVAARVPLVIGEFGTDNYGKACGVQGVDELLTWLDQHSASYLAWSWNVGSQACGSLSLISGWNGTPKAPNGTLYRQHLATLK